MSNRFLLGRRAYNGADDLQSCIGARFREYPEIRALVPAHSADRQIIT